MHFQRKHTNIKSNAMRVYVCARSFISFTVELKGVRLIRGLPRGVSSLVECTVVGADVAAVRVTLWCQWSDWGWLAAYIYISAYCSVVWCGGSEGSVHRCVEDVAPPACGWTCSPLTCRWTLPHFGISSCACHKWLWSLDTKKKKKIMSAELQTRHKLLILLVKESTGNIRDHEQ